VEAGGIGSRFRVGSKIEAKRQSHRRKWKIQWFLGRGDRNGVGVENRGKSLVGELIHCERWEARVCPTPGKTRVIRAQSRLVTRDKES
jgi:hypothetical protein